MSLPEKFDTLLDKNATVLSGGERQRLAIARGLLKKSHIFLCDEVTSNLDGSSENIVLDTLFLLAKSHIVIVVAHRKAMVEKIPRILVVDSGKVVAEGNHEYLIKTCTEYKKLFD